MINPRRFPAANYNLVVLGPDDLKRGLNGELVLPAELYVVHTLKKTLTCAAIYMIYEYPETFCITQTFPLS